MNEIFINAINKWRDMKGIGSFLIPYIFDSKELIILILSKVISKRNDSKCIIVTDSNIDSIIIKDNLFNNDNNVRFKEIYENKQLEIVTQQYVKDNDITNVYSLCICYNLGSIGHDVKQLVIASKFKALLFNAAKINNKLNYILNNIAPIINCFNEYEVQKVRNSSPVEEVLLSVEFPPDSSEYHVYEEYCKNITTSINIFGSFDNMIKANKGDVLMNISANQICNAIAAENGWHEYLDTNSEIDIQIDELYNPSNLRERAANIYNIIRARNILVTEYLGKIKYVIDIINKHKDKKILIINKSGNFANYVTDYLNTYNSNRVCLNYHDKVLNNFITNDKGNYITYKSGENKGKPKLFGSKAQMNHAVEMFNRNKINIISTNNSPNKDLSINVDVVIITSPFCKELKNYIYRLDKVNFNQSKLYLYTLYLNHTIEEKVLINRNKLTNKNNYGNDNINNDFVIVD